MAVVERDDQLAELDEWLASDVTRVIVLEGPLGSGKTSLMRVFANRATRAGYHRLIATCAPAEQAFPFGVVSQLLHNHTLPRWLRDRACALLDSPDAVRAATLAGAVEEFAAQRPLLFCVDDQRYCDAESLRWLTRVVDRAPVRLITTERTDDRPLTGFALQSQARRLTVPLLTLAGVTALTDARRAPELLAATGGNPMLLQALLQSESVFGRAVVAGLQGSDAEAVRIAGAAAVFDSSDSPAVLADIAGGETGVTMRVLACMERTGLLTDGRFRHPAARAAVLAHLTASERGAMHGRVATLLHDRGAAAGEIAAHLAQALDQPVWAGDVYAAASREALADNQVARAVAFLKPALALPGRPSLVLDAWQLDPLVAAPHLGSAGALDLPASVRVIGHLLWFGRLDEARARLAELPDDVRPAVAMWLQGAYPGSVVPDNREFFAPEPLASMAALSAALTAGAVAEVPLLAERLLAAVGTDVTWGVEPVLLALHGLVFVDRLDDATAWCTRLAAHTRLPVWHAVLKAVLAEIACRRGDFTTTIRHAETALGVLPARAWGVVIGLPLGALVLALTRIGDHRAALRHLAAVVPATMPASRYWLNYLFARGHCRLAADQANAALADFTRCGELMKQWRLDLPGVVPWRTGAAEAWSRLGDAEQVWRHARAQLDLPDIADARSRGTALRLLATINSPERRTRLLAEAVTVLERRDDRYELARALTELAAAQAALHRKKLAKVTAQRGLDTARACGAKPLCHDAARIIDAVEPRQCSEDAMLSLTKAEQRVASLAASGYKNREIAERLFVTVSTVEQHLTRVFRKLNVRQRNELPISLMKTA